MKYVFQTKQITGINELKTLTKHISCKWKCKLDGTKRNSISGGKMIHVNAKINVFVKMENISQVLWMI